MKLIAPQAPHTALFSNLLQPETEKNTMVEKTDSYRDTEGTAGGDVFSLSEEKKQTDRCRPSQCKASI